MCIRDRCSRGLVRYTEADNQEQALHHLADQARVGGQQHRRQVLSLIHISEPTRLLSISYAVFCFTRLLSISYAVFCFIFFFFFFFFNDTATTEIYTRKIVGSVRCV